MTRPSVPALSPPALRLALALAVFALAAAIRVWLNVTAPQMIVDTSYITVAENIQVRGCVSAQAGSCAPDWGGNQLPGYPAFLAAARAGLAMAGIEGSFVAPQVWRGLVVAQSLVYAAACAWLALAVLAWRRSWPAALAVGAVAALSPATLLWPRFLLTECLTSAATLWVVAEILFSFAAGRLRRISLGVALAVAAFLRYDSVVLALPVCLAAFVLHTPRQAFRRLCLVAAVAALPLGAWWGRSVAAGLSPVPSVMIAPQGWRRPVGIQQWMNTWVKDEPELIMFWWPVLTADYDQIRLFPENHSNAEKARLGPLLNELARYRGREIPAALDDSFARLAQDRVAAAPWRVRLGLPVERGIILWTAPSDILNHGWPRKPNWMGTAGLWTREWLLGALALSVVVLALASWRRMVPVAALAGGGLLAALGKTVLLSVMGAVEPRYLVELAPLLEVGALAGAAALIPTHARLALVQTEAGG